MRNENSNRVNMVNTTITYVEANSTPTSGIPAFAVTLTAVKSKMVLINSLNLIGGGSTKGVTLDTNLIRKAMTQAAFRVASCVLAYARSTNNNTLVELVNYTERRLDKLKKEDVDDVCEGILNAATANVAGATNFGLVASDLTDLAAAIALYRMSTQNSRQALITKSQAIEQIDVMLRELIADLLKGQMDNMVNSVKNANLAYWKGYRQARKVINLGTTTAKVRGEVRDENTSPLKNVVFTIFETGTLTKVGEAETDVKGNFGIAQLPSGDFDFKWEKGGYSPVTETNVHIGPGKELKRKIVMHALVVEEGDLMMMLIANINLQGNGIEPTSVITLEAMNSTMRFYSSNSPAGLPGAQFVDVQAGQIVRHTVQEFMNLVGNGQYSNVQNVGGVMGHWRVTVEI